jgi:hypothetical protein
VDGLRALAELLGDAVARSAESDVAAVLRLYLAGIFAYAGIAKLRRPWPSALALVNFGLTTRPRRGAGRAVGLAEVATAVLLLVPAPVALLGAAGAVGLLGTFTVLLARSLRRGERFPCSCLGQDDEDLSPATLVRTSALLALALVVAGGGAASADMWQSPDWYYAIVLAAFALITPMLWLRTLRNNRASKELFDDIEWGEISVGNIGKLAQLRERGLVPRSPATSTTTPVEPPGPMGPGSAIPVGTNGG